MDIQVFASDLDGTLLSEESMISEETIKAVNRVQNVGKYFVIVTGRAWGTVCPILKKAEIKADCVLLNGAEFRTASGKVIFQEAIEKDISEKILSYLLDLEIDFEVNTDNGDYSTNTEVCSTSTEFKDFIQIMTHASKILKIFVFSDNIILVEKVKQYLKKWQGISVTSSSGKNVEITSDRAEKGKMLERVAEFYHIDNDKIMVFGDGDNDETMFKKFRHSCAVENAALSIKELAENVIESNQENGVAKEINKVLGG